MKQLKTCQIVGIFAGILALAALSCSGVADVSNLFATDTPTPTNTFTPSPTVTPSPTATLTQTPSPSATPALTGSKTDEQADGSTLFTDYDNKYQVLLPEGWMILPFSSKDMADILQSLSATNPDFKEMAENFKNLDPDVIRAMALNMDAKYRQGGASPSLSLIAIDNKVMSSMPMDFVIGSFEESITQQGAQLSAESTAITNSNDVEIGSFNYVENIPMPAGGKIPVRYKAIVFRSGDKMILVQLGTPEKFEEQILPIMEQITDSIELIEE
jgi:hypothetical protein